MITAIALKETGYLWGTLRAKGLSTKEILNLCVGDTFDFPKRKAFPKNKTELLKYKDGDEMFKVARQALVDIGKYNSAYRRVAKKYPNKFCRGFGIFQYDLQFYKKTPDFFLKQNWSDFSKCLDLFVNQELIPTMKALYGHRKTLSDKEMVYVAIGYNIGAGKVKFNRGFKQGHKVCIKYRRRFGKKKCVRYKYYGQYIDEYLKLAKTIQV